jgi:extracellular factor (EF) 3-hydroxypalmitic acid methyl ester biosynthesis protein
LFLFSVDPWCSVREMAIAAACRRCERKMSAGEIETAMDEFVAALASTRSALTPAEWQSAATAFAADRVHALLLSDPYTAGAFRKSRGYAGDADTLDFVYRFREAPPDTTELGRRLLQITTDVPIACAVRARTRYLSDRIAAVRAAKPDAVIVSIACGHMRELEGLEPETVSSGRIYGLDHDEQTLVRLTRLHAGAVTPRNASVRQMLAQAESVPRADLIYASGLFDYLDDRVAGLLIRRLRARLLPQGSLLVTNLTARNDEIGYMEAMMDWWMVYRDEEGLRRLACDDSGTFRTCSLMNDRVACLTVEA